MGKRQNFKGDKTKYFYAWISLVRHLQFKAVLQQSTPAAEASGDTLQQSVVEARPRLRPNHRGSPGPGPG